MRLIASLSLALLVGAGSCVLDWDVPEDGVGGAGVAGAGGEAGSAGTGGGNGGAGGLGPELTCCFVCGPMRPTTCGIAMLDGTYESACNTRGYAFEPGVGCFEFRSCDCANCEQLPQTIGACQDLVIGTCHDCVFDST